MRKQLIAVLFVLLPAMSSAAGGTWDGIYSCGYNLLGRVYNVYVTINGQPDGRAIFAVAAVSDNNPFYGFGVGAVAGSTFTGTTMFGLPFSAQATSTGFTGTIQSLVNNHPVNASGTCVMIW